METNLQSTTNTFIGLETRTAFAQGPLMNGPTNTANDSEARMHNLYGVNIIRCRDSREVEIDTSNGLRWVIDYATNGPLALNIHPKVVQGAIDAIARFGAVHASVASARAHTGLMPEILNRLEEMKGGKSFARVYPTTFAANIATAGGLAKMDCTFVVHPNAHATVQFALKGACAQQRLIFTKNTVEVATAFAKSTGRPIVIVEDGLYSMGNFADFTKIKNFLDTHPNNFVWFDDAHSVGMRGRDGRGEAMDQMEDFTDQCIVSGSFGKAFGAAGGFIVGPSSFVKNMLGVSVSDRFSCNLDIAGQGAVLAAMDLLRNTRYLWALQRNLALKLLRFDEVLISNGVITEQAKKPIAFRVIPFDSPMDAIHTASSLLNKSNFLTTPVYYPTIAQGKGAIRIAVSVGHRMESIDQLLEELVLLMNQKKTKEVA